MIYPGETGLVPGTERTNMSQNALFRLPFAMRPVSPHLNAGITRPIRTFNIYKPREGQAESVFITGHGLQWFAIVRTLQKSAQRTGKLASAKLPYVPLIPPNRAFNDFVGLWRHQVTPDDAQLPKLTALPPRKGNPCRNWILRTSPLQA